MQLQITTSKVVAQLTKGKEMIEENKNESNEQLSEEEFFKALDERESDDDEEEEPRIHESQAKWFPYR